MASSLAPKKDRLTGEIEAIAEDFQLPLGLRVMGGLVRMANRDATLSALSSAGHPMCLGDGVLKPFCGAKMVRRFDHEGTGEQFWCCPRKPFCGGKQYDGHVQSEHFDFELPAEWGAQGITASDTKQDEDEGKVEDVNAEGKGSPKSKAKKASKRAPKAPKFRVLAKNKYPEARIRNEMLVPDAGLRSPQ